ncbi:NAC domain containing protein 19 [Euphorbia peplus]|nr:NAC domain containing protein 19 [Euphorbia peplus]
MSIPFVGFKFVPTDEELLGEFLFKRLTGTLCPNGSILIPCYDLYSKEEPWQVFQRFHPNPSYGHNECLYFFTQLKKKTIHSRASRKVGDGTWHGEDAGKKIVVDVELDGEKVSLKALKKRFSYRNKKSDQNCCWTMLEFSISEFNGEPEVVLCQLKKNDSTAMASPKREVVNKKRKLEVSNDNVDYSHNESQLLGDEITADSIEKASVTSVSDTNGESMVVHDESQLEFTNNTVQSSDTSVGDTNAERMVIPNELQLEFTNNNESDGDSSVIVRELELELMNNTDTDGEGIVLRDEQKLGFDYNVDTETNNEDMEHRDEEMDMDYFWSSMLNMDEISSFTF